MDSREGMEWGAVAAAVAAEAAARGLPVGFRFMPSDEELVRDYLRNKILKNPIPADPIKDIQISELFQNPPNCLVPRNSSDREWYFFIPLGEGFDQKTNEIQCVGNGEGFWKFVGDSYPIRSTRGEVIALKKESVYFRGRITKPKKTHWAMELYQLPLECWNNFKLNQQSVERWSVIKIRRGKSYDPD